MKPSLTGTYVVAATGNRIKVTKEKRGRKSVYKWHSGMKLFARDIGSATVLRRMIAKGQIYKPMRVKPRASQATQHILSG